MATEKDTAVIVRLDIPPSTHPATIKGKSPGANLGRATLTSIYDAYARVNDVASQVTDKGRLASAATPFIERAIKQAGRCIETLDQQIKSLDTLIAEKINTPVEPNLAGQIRSHFAARKSAMSEIGAAIEAGDTATASAVTTAATGSGAPGTVYAGLGDGGTDAVIGTTGGEATEFGEYLVEDLTINVVKTQAVVDPSGGTDAIVGATITYTITVEVVSVGTATSSSVVDLIPTWSTFVPNSITLNGLAISDATDGDAGEYDITGAATVVVRLGDLTLADGLQSVVFQVTID